MHNLTDILTASKGNITEKALRNTGLGYSGVRYVVTLLDELGLAKREARRQRVLCVPLAEALTQLAGYDIPRMTEHTRKRHYIPPTDVMRLTYDPLRLFAPGATFPADQVLPRHYAPDEPDQWAIGTRFERRKPGKPRQIYVYDGERVRLE